MLKKFRGMKILATNGLVHNVLLISSIFKSAIFHDENALASNPRDIIDIHFREGPKAPLELLITISS